MSIVVVKEVKTVTVRAEGIQPPSGGAGDMLATVYDPTNVNGDAFDMDNMAESATKKILTSTERAQIATNKTNADASKIKTDFISVTQAVDLDVIESDTTANNAKVSKVDLLTENATVTGAHNIDWDYDTFNYTLTGNTTWTDVNLPTSGTNSKVITLYVIGDFAITYPANWGTNKIGVYDGTVLNQIVVEYVKSGVYWLTINQAD